MFVNLGSIGADLAGLAGRRHGGQWLDLHQQRGWINQGTLQVDAGATLALAGSGWTNTGRIAVDGGTLDLGAISGAGPFTTAGLGIFAPAPAGNFSRTGGTVNLTGKLDNTGSTLALDARTGGWDVSGGDDHRRHDHHRRRLCS